MERRKISPYDLVAIFEERRQIREGKKVRRLVVREIPQDYFAVAKQRIYEYAKEKQLDKRSFYKEIQRVEYYLCNDAHKDHWNNEGFEAVMKILLERDSYYDSHLKPTAMAAGKRALEELGKGNGELSRLQREAYEWLAENMEFLDEVYHRNFMDHY